MAKSANYHVPFRRRREGKTNFHRRQRLLRSTEARVVVRRSNKHQRVSIVTAKQIGDVTVVFASSQHLKDYGWKGATGNVPAAYLTGYLAGKYAQTMGVKQANLDIGINSCRKETRVSAMLCGLVNSKFEIPHDPEVFPSEERYSGKHIADYAEKLKAENTELYTKQFAEYKKASAKPESIPTYFKATVKAIDEEFSSGVMKTKLKDRNKKNQMKPKTKPVQPKKAPVTSKKTIDTKPKVAETTSKSTATKTATTNVKETEPKEKQKTIPPTKIEVKPSKAPLKPVDSKPKETLKVPTEKPKETPKAEMKSSKTESKATPAKKETKTTKTTAKKSESSGKSTDTKKATTTKTKK